MTMPFAQLSRAVGWSHSHVTSVAYPSLGEVRLLLDEIKSGSDDAAKKVLSLYRFLPSPKTDWEKSVMSLVVQGFNVIHHW